MKRPRIGELRRRLVIETPERLADGGGGATTTWATLGPVWASIAPTSGAEAAPADMISGSITHTIVIRHRSDVVPAMRFRLGTRLFEIAAAIDVDEGGRFLRCLCRERDL